MESAETHTVLAESAPGVLFELLDVVGDILPEDHAEAFHEPESQSAGKAFDVLCRVEGDERFEQGLDMFAHPGVEAVLDVLPGRARQLVVGDDNDPRPQDVVALLETCDRFPVPYQPPAVANGDRVVRGGGESFRPLGDFVCDDLQGCGADGPPLGTFAVIVGDEVKADQPAGVLALDDNLPLARH